MNIKSTKTINEAIELFISRRSIRSYQEREVSEEQIRAMLDAAMCAPSAVATDPWRFVVLRTPEQKAAVASGLPHGKMLANASVGFAVCGEIASAHTQHISYLIQDCSAAIENLLLAAHAMGLGAVWLGVHPREDRIAHVSKTLNLPEGIIPISCIAVGYPAEKKPARSRYNKQYIHWEHW
ncbi:MAG: nitroreductase family protein [Deltaproteobacteria bacterium]|nr:nitroreductase family protein [Deltaproteobacteria bacterium]